MRKPDVFSQLFLYKVDFSNFYLEDVTLEAGAQSVALIEEPVAAAIGAGLRIADARGSMIVDIGGGTTEVAVLSYGGIVISKSLRTAGNELDEAIAAYIKKKYNVLIGDVTAEALKNVKPSSVSENAVCKIVSDYEWFIAVTLPFSESLNLKEDSKVTLMTSLPSVPELTATVKYINKQSVGKEAVVVFACDTMNHELAQIRNIDITVVYERYEGLKVDNRAIRMLDGQKGVYVLLASQVKFVPIEVIWSGENYSIVKREASEKKVLRIYDEIIVKGKNLYDGKIIE